MLALVIDTSSAAVTAALVDVADECQVVAQRVTIDARAHGELLAPSIKACVDEAGAALRDIRAVVAGLGPGPFTGLRVGLVTAAVFADALAIPTYGVCSLDAIGTACADEPSLLVATDARRKEVYWARYASGLRFGEPQVSHPGDIAVDDIAAIAGVGADLYDFRLRRRAVVYPPARELALHAGERIRSDAATELLTPMYLRRPDAVANISSKPVTQ